MDLQGWGGERRSVIPDLFPWPVPCRARGLRPYNRAVCKHTTHPMWAGVQVVLSREATNNPEKCFCLSTGAIHLVLCSSFSYCRCRWALAATRFWDHFCYCFLLHTRERLLSFVCMYLSQSHSSFRTMAPWTYLCPHLSCCRTNRMSM